MGWRKKIETPKRDAFQASDINFGLQEVRSTFDTSVEENGASVGHDTVLRDAPGVWAEHCRLRTQQSNANVRSEDC